MNYSTSVLSNISEMVGFFSVQEFLMKNKSFRRINELKMVIEGQNCQKYFNACLNLLHDDGIVNKSLFFISRENLSFLREFNNLKSSYMADIYLLNDLTESYNLWKQRVDPSSK